MNTPQHTKAYAIAYANTTSDRRLLTPAYVTVELALTYLYTCVDDWQDAVIKTVTHTAQTRHSI